MTEAVHPKTPSPFLSVFRKKKAAPTPSAVPVVPSAPATPKSPSLTFTQRVRMHKDLRQGKVPEVLIPQSQSQILPSTSMAPLLPLERRKPSDKKEWRQRTKAVSVDAIDEMDPVYLMEALEAIGDDQPLVARSIPKHAILEHDPAKDEQRRRANCLYEPEVYDKMLAESLMVCDMLQLHLDDCIANTRAKTPSPTKQRSPLSPKGVKPTPVHTTTTKPTAATAASPLASASKVSKKLTFAM